jgi:cytochrome c553
VPKLAGQNADFLFVALKAYKADAQPLTGRSNGVMGGIAKKYTNAELKDLAGYIASLPGEVKTIPESRIHHAGK